MVGSFEAVGDSAAGSNDEGNWKDLEGLKMATEASDANDSEKAEEDAVKSELMILVNGSIDKKFKIYRENPEAYKDKNMAAAVIKSVVDDYAKESLQTISTPEIKGLDEETVNYAQEKKKLMEQIEVLKTEQVEKISRNSTVKNAIHGFAEERIAEIAA